MKRNIAALLLATGGALLLAGAWMLHKADQLNKQAARILATRAQPTGPAVKRAGPLERSPIPLPLAIATSPLAHDKAEKDKPAPSKAQPAQR